MGLAAFNRMRRIAAEKVQAEMLEAEKGEESGDVGDKTPEGDDQKKDDQTPDGEGQKSEEESSGEESGDQKSDEKTGDGESDGTPEKEAPVEKPTRRSRK